MLSLRQLFVFNYLRMAGPAIRETVVSLTWLETAKKDSANTVMNRILFNMIIYLSVN